MSYQTPYNQQEMPAFMIEHFACLPCNDNESLGSFENDSDIDVSFSSRGSAYSYLSTGVSPMARALERVGNEVTVEVPQQQQSRRQRNNKQSKKSRRKQARQKQPSMPPSMQPCRFFRSKKGCSRPDCPFVHC